jgi:hypothetical protein
VIPPNAKIHDIERVQPQVADIVMHTVDQFLTRKSVNPGLVVTTAGTHLGDNHQAVRKRMKRFPNHLIRHMRAIEVARIDMVHACGDRLSQDCNRGVNITRRSPHLRTGKLHRAIAHAVYGELAFHS